jgi:homoaconitase/3-isopropylmalate dehydratase large subunit
VFGWGVGGIEAQAALLGRTLSIASPEIIGVELLGRPSEHIAAANVALALTARSRLVIRMHFAAQSRCHLSRNKIGGNCGCQYFVPYIYTKVRW